MIIFFWYWTMEKCSLCCGGRIRFLMGYCPLTDDHRSDTALSECIIIVSISPPGAWEWSAGGHCPMMYRFPVSWRQLSQYGWFVEFRANDRVNTQHQQTSDRVNTQHQPVTGQASCEPEDVVCRDLGEREPRPGTRREGGSETASCSGLIVPFYPALLSDSHPSRSN